MARIKEFLNRVRESIKGISLKTYVTFLLEGIGLFANLIAILSFFGAINTPESSPNFYINNQEFLAWSTIAVVYTLGIFTARMKRRWRKKFQLEKNTESNFFEMIIGLGSDENYWMRLRRHLSFTLVISFPIIYLYVRAIQTVTSSGTASPWSSSFTTVILSFPISIIGVVVSNVFDNALSLYEGD